MTITYSELHKLAVDYNNRYKAWEEDLYKEASSLCNLLKKKISAPEELPAQKLTKDELRWHLVMLEKPFYDTNQNDKPEDTLLRQNDFHKFIQDDGSLLFSISINFPTKELDLSQIPSFPPDDILGIRIILRVHFVNSEPFYGMCHSKTYELSSDEISQEEMAEKLIKQYLELIEFDPYSGKEKPKFGF